MVASHAPREPAAPEDADEVPEKSPQSKQRRNQQQRQGKKFYSHPKPIALDQKSFLGRILSERLRMPVADLRQRCIRALPSAPPGPQPEVGIVAVSEKLLVEDADVRKHEPPIQRGAAVREKHFLGDVKLPVIEFPRAAPAIQAVRIEQKANLVDYLASIIKHDL